MRGNASARPSSLHYTNLWGILSPYGAVRAIAITMTVIRPLLLSLALYTLAISQLPAAAQSGPQADPPDLLQRYVQQVPAGFGFIVRDGGRYRGAEWVELILTSQTWRGLPWRHQLYIIRPQKFDGPTGQALLFVDGGKWRPEYERPPVDHELPKRADVYLGIANRLASPVVVLRQVPNQPLFGGLKEDELIAYTLDQYLRSKDPDWPILLPMVRSVVSAMDAVQRYAMQHWSAAIEGFTVTGASKRGWTTWLVAAVDPRVRAIAPMVFDVLNMGPQMKHQRWSWGSLSEQIGDYSSRSLTEKISETSGQRLASIVDPFSYRNRITQPKIVILASNDRYWPVDAAELYWGELRGTRLSLYVPNQGHKLTDLPRIVGALDAIHRHSAHDEPLPELTWTWTEEDGRLLLRMRAEPSPSSARAWLARSDSRDLRDSRWRMIATPLRKGHYVLSVDLPKDSYLGVFGEAVFGNGSERVFLSTLPRVISPANAATRPEITATSQSPPGGTGQPAKPRARRPPAPNESADKAGT